MVTIVIQLDDDGECNEISFKENDEKSRYKHNEDTQAELYFVFEIL